MVTQVVFIPDLDSVPPLLHCRVRQGYSYPRRPTEDVLFENFPHRIRTVYRQLGEPIAQPCHRVITTDPKLIYPGAYFRYRSRFT